MLEVKKLRKKDIKELVKVAKEVFCNKNTKQYISDIYHITNIVGVSKNDLKLMYKGKMIGFHMFSESNIESYIKDDNTIILKNLKKYNGKKAIMGFAFGISRYYRKRGFAKFFVEYEKEHFKGKYDYMWGENDSLLNSINFWSKYRNIVGFEDIKEQKRKVFYTIMDL